MNAFKTKWLFWMAGLCIIVSCPGISLAYSVNGTVTCALVGWPAQGAKVEVYDIDPLPGNTYHTDAVPLGATYVNPSGNFSITFTWPTATPDFEVGGPDVVFRISQNIGGSVEIIYEEDPSQAHWNVSSGDSFSITITSPKAVCLDPSLQPQNNNDFLFTRIGSCEVAHLSKGQNNLASLGYFRARADGHTGNPNIPEPGTDTDQPFGRTLDLFGWFGLVSDAKCYEVKYRYSTDNGTTWSGWYEVDKYLSNKWYDSVNYKWMPEKMGPFSPGPPGSPTNLYKIPFKWRPGKTWSYIDRIALFNTLQVPDGLCEVKVEGFVWDWDENHAATPATNLDNNLPDSKIIIRIDNSPPTVKILGLKLNGSSTGVCQILNFGSGDSINVDFRVWDQKGHLGNYVLDAMYGHDCYVKPRPPAPNKAYDSYNNNASGNPSWQGSLSYSTQYNGSTYNAISPTLTLDCSSLSYSQMLSNVMPTCAYQFRLTVTKRTTNGYGLIHRNVEDTWHVTIKRY